MAGVSSDGSSSSRKMAIMGISSLLLVAMVIAVGVSVSHNHPKSSNASGTSSSGSNVSTSNKNIEALCQPTDYRETCTKTLEASSAADSTDPSVLIEASFDAAAAEIKKAVANSNTINEAEKDPRTAGAVKVCKEVMGYAAGDLEKSVRQLKIMDFTELDEFVEDIKTWLSGAITFHETCIDAFENTTGDASQKMKKLLNISRELSSNGLAMTNQLSTLIKSLDLSGLQNSLHARRRLLTAVPPEGPSMVPSWLPPIWFFGGKNRKLIEAAGTTKADVVVAKDGSGKYKTVGEALKDVPLKSNKTFVIHIKEGVYAENVVVGVDMWNVVFIGDGPTKTKITGNRSFADGTPTYETATVAVLGDQFMAKNIGFENTASLNKRYAVALLSQSDRSIFYNCHMSGYMYTLYAVAYRQFYRDCTISGSVDFVTGDAAVVLQNCTLLIRPPTGQTSQDEEEEPWCNVVAQGRAEVREHSGTVLQNCTIAATDGDKTKTYLARPWKKFSRVVVMETRLEDVVAPEGWKPWMGSFGQDTCFFAEYNNTGAGAKQDKRVKWAGVKKVDGREAEGFTVGNFLLGNDWIKQTEVPYVGGMTNA